MSKRLRHGRGGRLATIIIRSLPTTVGVRDVRAALFDRGAGRVASVELEPAAGESRTARARLAWRGAQRVLASSGAGSWPFTRDSEAECRRKLEALEAERLKGGARFL